uniref:Uncharacterized protein n=1 Tax=Pavo cristatus TaxID=9049 RepID=A0A8C9FMP0_PAVCR
RPAGDGVTQLQQSLALAAGFEREHRSRCPDLGLTVLPPGTGEKRTQPIQAEITPEGLTLLGGKERASPSARGYCPGEAEIHAASTAPPEQRR